MVIHRIRAFLPFVFVGLALLFVAGREAYYMALEWEPKEDLATSTELIDQFEIVVFNKFISVSGIKASDAVLRRGRSFNVHGSQKVFSVFYNSKTYPNMNRELAKRASKEKLDLPPAAPDGSWLTEQLEKIVGHSVFSNKAIWPDEYFITFRRWRDDTLARLTKGWQGQVQPKSLDQKGKCMALILGDKLGYIKAVTVNVSPDLGRDAAQRCIWQGVSVGIGLYGGASNSTIDSVVTTNGWKFGNLTLNDKIIIRTLYDSRIKPGMAKAEAMGLARVIIPELIAAVKKDGEVALYQKER